LSAAGIIYLLTTPPRTAHLGAHSTAPLGQHTHTYAALLNYMPLQITWENKAGEETKSRWENKTDRIARTP